MRTAERDVALPRPSSEAGPRRPGRLAVVLAGPALIVVSVLISLRAFAFEALLTNQHPDILSFWLPRSCFMGRSLAAGHVPLWNPFEMAGTPFAADPQSGWLYLPWMMLSRFLSCGTGLRAFIVLQPILAGLGLLWFLRREGVGRVGATAGGLSVAMMISASNVAVSLPFAGMLAWTPFVLVGASGALSETTWPRRLGWLALGAVAWGQVASAHLSHGLIVCTGLAGAYVLARSMHEARSGSTPRRVVLSYAVLFLAFLPLANLAVLVPHLALIPHTSLRGGYSVLGGTLARISGVEDRPIPMNGIWGGWPFALAGTPGAYAGAAVLLAIPASLRIRRLRYLTAAFAMATTAAYVLTLTAFVRTGWIRNLLLRLPFGDVYLHNPGRLRYLVILVAPVLGALGIQGFLERRPSRREAAWWMGGGTALFLVVPLLLGAYPVRLIVFAIGIAATVPVVFALIRGRGWARVALPAVLAADLLAGALWSTTYQGGTVYFGLEGPRPGLAPQPLRWPTVPVRQYLEPGPIARYLQLHQGEGRYLAWIPPAAYFNKGYLFTQDQPDWPALLLGRAMLFGLHDALGYSPVQLPRYWSYIRATNRLPVYYNAAVLQLPSLADLRLLGIDDLVVAHGIGLPPSLSGTEVASEHGYELVRVDGAEPRVSVVPSWTVVPAGVESLEAIRDPGFDPSATAVVEGDPGIVSAQPGASAGSASYAETWPEDVVVRVDAAAPSIVVVRNAWAEGWTATVDGKPAPVLRADYLLQGVPVPAGSHVVRLTYRDSSIGRGIALSAAVWVAWALGLALPTALARRRRRARSRQAS
jgi:Bacterial membrane protein YfhO